MSTLLRAFEAAPEEDKDTVSQALMSQILDFLAAIDTIRRDSRIQGKPMTWSQVGQYLDSESDAVKLVEEWIPSDVPEEEYDNEAHRILGLLMRHRKPLIEALHNETNPKRRKAIFLQATGQTGPTKGKIALVALASMVAAITVAGLGYFIWQYTKKSLWYKWLQDYIIDKSMYFIRPQQLYLITLMHILDCFQAVKIQSETTLMQ